MSANGSKEPQSVRERLRAGAEEHGDRIEAFFALALDAERETWTTCEKCQRKTAVVVPDWSARLKAVTELIDQGYGRPKSVAAEEEPLAIIVERMWPGLDDETREHLTDEEIALVEEAQELYNDAKAAATKKKLAATRHG